MALTPIRDWDERHDPPRPLLEHLLALREALIFAFVSWLVGFGVALAAAPWVLSFITSRASACLGLLQCTELTEPFWIWMSIGAWGGTAISFPFWVYAVLRFVFPALSRREKAFILVLLLSGTVLFTLGAFLAYWQTLPLAIQAFHSMAGLLHVKQEIISLGSYVPLVMKLIFAFGLVFQVPLVLTSLGWLGVLTSRGLREKRRIAIVIAFILGMVLTPPDPLSQILMALPLCLLYEISILIVASKERLTGRNKE